MSSFNEANTIEEALIDKLSSGRGLNWEYVHGEQLPKQAGDVLIGEYLHEALCKLNPELSEENANDVIYKLRGVLLEARNSGLVRANELFMEWLLAEKSQPFGEDGEHITIRLIDFDQPKNNHYVISRQVEFIGESQAFFDLVLYVNGIPLAVGEVKSPVRGAISWQDGAADFMGGKKRYWEYCKTFFVPNLLCFASEGKTFAYASIGAGFKNWMPWHSTKDEGSIPKSLRSVLKSANGLLNPKTLLEMLRSFAVFSTTKTDDGKPGKKIKILARYPQFEAANQIVDRVVDGKVRQGLIWHFQGSGKSLLMLFAARMLKARKDLGNPTVIVVVDRKDLDSQINAVFDNADIKNVTPAKNCKDLEQKLRQDTRHVLVTTVFKFQELVIDENKPDGLNPRDNIIVLVDEAHRTQEGDLGGKMRWALPNAFFFGLTGTPISGLEKNTFKLFGAEQDPGRYLNRYSYKQSIRDEATLPVKFDPRLVELRIDQDEIDAELDKLAKANNLTDEEKAQLSERGGKLAHLLTAPDRLETVADDIVKHFESHVEPKALKGMVVVYNRDACVLMYDLLSKRLGNDAVEVVMNISGSTVEDEKDDNGQPRKKSKDWLEWTRKGYPITKEDFKRWQAIDDETGVQERLLEDYKAKNHPLKLIIVTAKLLTGFDAPICYAMYLDKPLRDHTLLQAMCRTNRLYGPNKRNGLVLDYLGVFENVAKALDYDPKEIEGVIEALEAMKKLFPEAMKLCLEFFPNVNRTIGGFAGLMAAQDCLPTQDDRDKFAAQFNVLRRMWDALHPDPFLTPYKDDYRWLAQVFDSLRPPSGGGTLLWEQLGPETIKLIHENVTVQKVRDDLEELTIDDKAMLELTDEERKKHAQKLEFSLIGKIRNRDEPEFRALGERLERLRADYEAGVLSSLEWLKELLDAAKATVQAENQTETQVVSEDNVKALSKLFQELKQDATPEIIGRLVEDIDDIVKATRFDGWQSSKKGEREVRQVLRKTLKK